ASGEPEAVVFNSSRKVEVRGSLGSASLPAGLELAIDNALAGRTVEQVVSGRGVRLSLGEIASLDDPRFASTRGFTFVFVGSIDTVAIMPLIEKYIASLPAAGKVEQAKDLNINIPAGIIERTVYKGTEAKANVNLVFSGPFEYNFGDKIKMEALKETLQIRLIERLREEEGGVYSPGVRMGIAKLPQGRFSLTISFGCAPENVDKLVASSLDEIEKIKATGPVPVNLDKFKAETQRSIELSLKSNGFWLGYLSGQLQNNESLDQIDGYTKQLGSITTADVKDIAGKYLSGKNYIKLVLLPQKAE
ncbi:MAG: insulinase family protein, partial [Sphingobacteriaceae bacterium]